MTQEDPTPKRVQSDTTPEPPIAVEHGGGDTGESHAGLRERNGPALHVYPSLQDAEIAVLPEEVKAGAVRAWDARGVPLASDVEQQPSPVPGSVTRQIVEVARLRPAEGAQAEPEALAERLRAALAEHGGEASESEGSLDDLIARAAEILGPRPRTES